MAAAPSAAPAPQSTKRMSEVRGSQQEALEAEGHRPRPPGQPQARPHWVGGGTVFGPKPRTTSTRCRARSRSGALRSALSLRAGEQKLIVLDELRRPTAKTKAVAAALSRSGRRQPTSKVLIVDAKDNDEPRPRRRATSPSLEVARPRGPQRLRHPPPRARWSSPRPPCKQVEARSLRAARAESVMRAAQTIIKRPLLTEKTRACARPAAPTTPRRGRGLRPAGRVRGRPRREQDRDPARRREPVQGHGRPTSAP